MDEEHEISGFSDTSEVDIGFLESRMKHIDEQIQSTNINQIKIGDVKRALFCKCGNAKVYFCDICRVGYCLPCQTRHRTESPNHAVITYDVLKPKVRKEASEIFSKMLAVVNELKELVATPTAVIEKEIAKSRVGKRAMTRMTLGFYKGICKNVEETMLAGEKHQNLQSHFFVLSSMLNEMKRTFYADNSTNEDYEAYYDGFLHRKFSEIVYKIDEERCRETRSVPVLISLNKNCVGAVNELLHDMVTIRIDQIDKERHVIIAPPYVEATMGIAFYIPETKELKYMNSFDENTVKTVNLHSGNQLPTFSELVFDDDNNIYFVGNGFKLVKDGPTIPSKNTFKLSLAESKFSQFSELSTERFKTCSLYYKKCIYLFGGFITYNQIRTRTCEFIDTTEPNPRWKPFPKMIKPRSGATVCHFLSEDKKSYFYAFGGLCNPSMPEKAIERFDFEKMKWEIISLQNQQSYFPLYNSFSLQINPEEIMVIGGVFDRRNKEKSRKAIILRTKCMCVEAFRDISPLGLGREGRSSQPIIYSSKIITCNALVGQSRPYYKQMATEFYVTEIGNDMISRISHMEFGRTGPGMLS